VEVLQSATDTIFLLHKESEGEEGSPESEEFNATLECSWKPVLKNLKLLMGVHGDESI